MKNLQNFYRLTSSRSYALTIIFIFLFLLIDILFADLNTRFQLRVILFFLLFIIGVFNYVGTYLFNEKELRTRRLWACILGVIVIISYIIYFKP